MKIFPVQPFKDKEFALTFYRHMVRARVLEERLITMAKSGEGFFWIGGPGEEAFNVALGMQVNKGHGLEFDYLHLHYRNNGVLLTMGLPMLDFVRQMACRSTDPFSGGRNFAGHVCYRPWNVVPVTSTIETQFVVAPGTAMAQRTHRLKGHPSGITIVVGGDAGSAEGDFASAMIWSSRPQAELPLLMIVTNNRWGISTEASSQHSERHVSDRAKAFGIKTAVVDGNNPEKIWQALHEALAYVRETGKPFMLEAMVSRLYGHSSSSGANRVAGEECCIESFEKKLFKLGWLDEAAIKAVWDNARQEAQEAREKALKEPEPDPGSVYHHTFANSLEGGVPGRDF